MRFGGFIITYQRPVIIQETIAKLFEQSFPPELIWVIDNSEDLATDHAIASLLDPRIKYFRMGYNAGPAGAAVKGLKLCAEEGLNWIYWGDDNDPPYRTDCFERLLAIRDQNPFVGILGVVGQFFDRKKGVVKRIQTRLLEKKPWVEVDFIAGGMCMLVNRKVVEEKILPDPDLFFGFEELDFCLKVSRRGYSLVVDCGLFLEARAKYNRTQFDSPMYLKKKNLNREYYSLRNLLFISDSLSLRSMRTSLILKWILKALYGFRYGPVYGFKNFRMISLAFWHYYKGVKGKTLAVD